MAPTQPSGDLIISSSKAKAQSARSTRIGLGYSHSFSRDLTFLTEILGLKGNNIQSGVRNISVLCNPNTGAEARQSWRRGEVLHMTLPCLATKISTILSHQGKEKQTNPIS